MRLQSSFFKKKHGDSKVKTTRKESKAKISIGMFKLTVTLLFSRKQPSVWESHAKRDIRKKSDATQAKGKHVN
jgi:hypothetical protein